MKTISVIVPVYNVEEYLDQCIESIITQTYVDLEIILVDDGSTDSSGQKCDEWEKKDDRIRVIHKENGGLSSARNAGIDIAKGKYLSFIDSDDYIKKEMYERMVEKFDENNIDIVKCAKEYIWDDSTSVDNSYCEKHIFSRKEALDLFFSNKYEFCGSSCDKLYKRELFDKIRFPENLNNEDYYVLIKLFDKIKYIYSDCEPFYCYRMRDNSITHKKEYNVHSLDGIKIASKIEEYVVENIPELSEGADELNHRQRFAVYYDAFMLLHSKEDEKKWRTDLRMHIRKVVKNKRLSFGFKIKYFIFSITPRGYLCLKKLNRL